MERVEVKGSGGGDGVQWGRGWVGRAGVGEAVHSLQFERALFPAFYLVGLLPLAMSCGAKQSLRGNCSFQS